MTVLTDTEIEEAIYAFYYDEDDEPLEFIDDYGDFWEWFLEEGNKDKTVLVGEHTFEYVTNGEEGFDNGLYIIFEIDGVLYRKDGWYASHDGTYWDGSVYPTKAVEKTITVWERA